MRRAVKKPEVTPHGVARTSVPQGASIPAGEFKARCLALLDEVARTGKPLVVTKRGKPVAKVVPVHKPPSRSLRGSLLECGDIVSPLGDEWDMER